LSHPGLLLIRRPYDVRNKRFSASIPVDEVRRLRAFLSHTAAGGAWRIVIVDSADDLNPSSANALLKSLEEPPARTLFVLISSQPGRLLPTIRSRCRTLELVPVRGEALRNAVGAALDTGDTTPPGAVDWTQLEQLSGGSVRQALALVGSDGLRIQARIEALLASLPGLDWSAAHKLGDDFAGVANTQKFETFFELLLGHLARLVRARATGEGKAEDLVLAQRVIAEHRLATWAELWETVVRDKAEAQTLNLDRKALILETLSRIEQSARA
jgi:DNA polymerase-3 subunit delta'